MFMFKPSFLSKTIGSATGDIENGLSKNPSSASASVRNEDVGEETTELVDTGDEDEDEDPDGLGLV